MPISTGVLAAEFRLVDNSGWLNRDAAQVSLTRKPQPMTVLLDTTDLGESEEVLSASYTRQRHRAPADSITRTRVVRSQLGSLILDAIEFSYDLSIEADPLADMVLRRIHSGFITQQFPAGQVEGCLPDEVTAVGARDSIPLNAKVFTARFDALTIGRDLLNRIATGPPDGNGDGPVLLASTVPISAIANNHLVKAIDYVRHGVMCDPFASQNSLIVSSIENYLAATVLAAFPTTALLEPTSGDRHDSTPVLLRRAIAFIEDNAYRDISVADIAQDVYVTPRALQYMFRKHSDCTPMEYLRRVRLHHAHLELIAGDRMSTTVGQIAARWGFGHLGRFAVYYREHYGQSPHLTLRG